MTIVPSVAHISEKKKSSSRIKLGKAVKEKTRERYRNIKGDGTEIQKMQQ